MIGTSAMTHNINKKFIYLLAAITLFAVATVTNRVEAVSRCRAPSWFTGSDLVREGDHLIVRCSAVAIIDEIAEIKASQICENEAIAEFLIKSAKNRPARPENEVGPPADLAPPPCIIGLGCDSPKMRSCKSEDEVTVWRRCSYNIGAAHEGTKKECGVAPPLEDPKVATKEDPTDAARTTPPQETLPPPGDATPAEAKTTSPANPPVSDFLLTITTNPICDEVLISGATERRYQCPSTLMEIPITAGDVTITVRANGRMDKVIPVESLGSDRRLDLSLEPSQEPAAGPAVAPAPGSAPPSTPEPASAPAP